MSADRFTTSPKAAAQYEADQTPAYDERQDRYDGLEGYVRNSWPINELIAAFGAMTKTIRCAHPHCRTSLNDKAFVQCGHGAFFCEGCVFEEGCGLCNDEAVAS